MKKLLSLLLCAILCVGSLTGCQAVQNLVQSVGEELELISPADTAETEETPATDAPETQTPNPDEQDPAQPVSRGFSDFDSALINFLRENGLQDENYTVSPLSFRSALALAALGAEGETQRQLLHTMGFRSTDEMLAWFDTVVGGVDFFNAYFDDNPDVERGDAAYEVVNSIWKNLDLPGEFTEEYRARAEQALRAYCGSASAEGLGDAVNKWVGEKTHGLIRDLVGDLSDSSAVLVNALYLKSAWVDPFGKIGNDVFTTRTGEKVDKSYMRQTGRFRYYADGETQLVSVPLQGGIYMVFILGSDVNLSAKLAKAESTRVEVTVPMFDVETTLNNGELLNFLIAQGCTRMLGNSAEFRGMFTEDLFIGDVIQKAKVHIDEEGLEAAAATAVVTYGSTGIPADPIVFRADHDFSFCIVSGMENPELLFWGQIVE